jgi:hypothetical protein
MNNLENEKQSDTARITLPAQVKIEKSFNAGTTAPSKSTLISSVENSDLVKSASMNLIDDTAEHLFDLMVSLEKDSNVHALHENVKVACHCADQIHKLLRLKLDVIKVAQKAR